MNHELLRSAIFRVPVTAGLISVLLLATMALPLIIVPEIHAAVLIVDTTADELNGSSGNGFCSLREAVTNANNDNSDQADCAAGDGTDVITLPAGTYTLTGASGENGNISGDLDITGVLTINGADKKTTFIQAGAYDPLTKTCSGRVDRVLHTLTNSSVSINDVTIRCGRAPDGTQGAVDKNGGGIYNYGDLTIKSCSIIRNRAGDGISFSRGGSGGGIYSHGPLELNDVSIAYNEAGDGDDGGDNFADRFGGYGGGVFLTYLETMTMTDCTITRNVGGRGGYGGDVSDGNAGKGGLGGIGGGIYNSGTLNVYTSQIYENESGIGGDGGDVTSGNGDGGGGGTGGYAAGIYCSSGSQLVFVDSAVEDNISGSGGSGGAGSGTGAPGSDGNLGYGGGVYLSSGTHTISGSAVSGNEAHQGGGFYNSNSAVTTINNTTISGNRADNSGGGIHTNNPAKLRLTYVTIANNTADRNNNGSGDGGGLYASLDNIDEDNNNDFFVTMANTIVAKNSDKSDEYPDLRGAIESVDYNLLGICDPPNCDFTAQTNDLVGSTASPVDPVLGSYADNGGPTMTHTIKSNGPAAGQIPEGVTGCSSTEFDQRGVMRLAPCDMGAYETGKVWGGGISSDWHTADNWLPGRIPEYNDPVTILVGGNEPSCNRSFAEAGGVIISGGALSLDDYDLSIGGNP